MIRPTGVMAGIVRPDGSEGGDMIMRREVTGPDGIRAMQRLCERIWWTGSSWHVGDIAWGRYRHIGREPEWPSAIWIDGDADPSAGRDAVLAWAWVRLPGHLDLAVDPGHPGLVDEVVDWFAGVATADEVSAYAFDTETHLTAALEARGFRAVDDPDGFLIRYDHDLVDLPEPVLPGGFTVRAVRGAADVAPRVEVHRSAFAPSRVTPESYARVMAAWPYRMDLDWVVAAPDGRLAASCLIWWDGHNRVGELEPVGTHADFRRLGLARAACLGAMRALRDLGARGAVVCSHDGPGHEGPPALYRGLGFVDRAHTVRYVTGRANLTR